MITGFDLAAAKQRLDITLTDKDTRIQAALDAAVNITENYLDRLLSSEERTERFFCHTGNCIHLVAYPVTAITKVEPSNDYTLNEANGMLCFGCGGGCSDIGRNDITVTYTGGYIELPADLMLALWHVFDGVWEKIDSSGASMAGISRISIPDVGTLAFNDSASGSEIENSPLGAIVYILNAYRRLSS